LTVADPRVADGIVVAGDAGAVLVSFADDVHGDFDLYLDLDLDLDGLGDSLGDSLGDDLGFGAVADAAFAGSRFFGFAVAVDSFRAGGDNGVSVLVGTSAAGGDEQSKNS